MRSRKNALVAMGLTISMLASMAIPAFAAETPSTVDTANAAETQLSPWLITEVVSDTADGERNTYVEIYNNSDQELDFSDYVLYYDYPSGGGFVFSENAEVTYTGTKAYTSAAFLSAEDSTVLTDIKVGAGEALVIWYNNNLSTTSLAEFKNFYNLDEDVNIIRANHAGIHQTDKRCYRIGKDSDTILVEAYSNENGNEIENSTNTGRLAYQFTYPLTGRKCEQTGIAVATPGTVSQDQVPSTRVTVSETPININNVNAIGVGDFVVTAEIPYEGTAGAMVVNLTYKQMAGTGEDAIESGNITVGMTPAGDGKTFIATVPANKVWGTSVEYSIMASYGGENKQSTEPATIALTRKTASADNAAPLVVTEISPSTEPFDYIEVYNQSDSVINLSYWKLLYYYDYPNQTAAQSGKTWSISDFMLTLDPGETMVYWLNEGKQHTVEEFNEKYGVNLVEGETITMVDYSGLHNSKARWFRIGTSESTAFTLAGFNEESWQIITAGNALHYAVPNDDAGVNESIAALNAAATPGTVASWQITGEQVPFAGYEDYQKDDGKKPTLEVCEVMDKPVPESINEGEDLQVIYDVDLLLGGGGGDARVNAFSGDYHGGSEALKERPRLLGTEIYYKLDNDTDWTVVKEKKQHSVGHYLMQLTSDVLYGHDQVTFKVRAYSLYGYSETEESTVKINRLNDTKGEVRLNVSDGALISGDTTITANDGKNNANTVIKVDDAEQTVKKTFENGAYFFIKASGMDTYFKNAITAPYGNNLRDTITILTSWRQLPASRAIRVDNKYFTYNEETDTYDVTLTVWAGGHGTPFEEIYEIVADANHEDYTVSGLQMKLTNGNSYLPVLIAPENEKTNNDTALNTVHAIGDSPGMSPHMEVSFSVPAEDAEAVGVTVKTKELADGEHTITATSGDKTTTATVVVDNTEPVIDFGIEQGATVYDTFAVDITNVSDANGINDVVVSLDDELLEYPATITPHELSAGEHKLKVAATDMAGNAATKELVFYTEEVNPNVLNSTNDEITYETVNLSVSLEEGAEATVTFLEGRTLTEENEGITASEVIAQGNGEAPYQLFAVNTGDVSGDTTLAVNWNGTASNADATHPLTMYVLDTATNTWTSIGTAVNGSISASFPAENHVSDGKAILLVQCLTAGTQPKVTAADAINAAAEEEGEAAKLSDWTGTDRPEDYDFAFAWETDTQYYTESFPYHYDQMNQWIADNAEDWKIRYVFHTGDIVDDCDMLGEWENADRSMKILDDAGIPYGVLGGNHDVYAGAEDYGSYWQFFGEDRFADKPYYGGSYKNNRGHYDLLTENGEDFIIVYMSWDIYQEELDWMNSVLQQYSDRKAILAFHRYINTSGELDYTGELIQDQVVAKNPNVFMVIDGHYHGASYRIDKFDDNGDGVKERTVYQVCTDYQSDPEGGSQYIKFMYFDLENNKLYLNSYSPYRDDFNFYNKAKMSDYSSEQKVGAIDICEFDVDFGGTESYNKTLTTNSISTDVKTRNVIGTVENAAGDVVYTWQGLTPGTIYNWYAEVTNVKNGITTTPVQSFTTKTLPVIEKYTITATAGDGGSISNLGTTEVTEGENVTYTITPDAGYQVKTVLVDGYVAELTDGTYTFENVTDAHTIVVIFEALAHDFTEEVVEPTCTELGYTIHTCKDCPYSYKDNYTNVIPHTYDAVETKAASCTEEGIMTYTCKCGNSYTETIPKTAHSYTDVVTAPTHDKMGYTTHTCVNCSYSYVDSYTDALEHKYERTVTKEASCTEEGVMTFACDCGKSYTQAISKADHNYKEETVAPGCETFGYVKLTCQNCDYTCITEITQPVGHALTVVGQKEATYEEEGYTGDTVCETCKKTIVKGKVIEKQILPCAGFEDVEADAWYHEAVDYNYMMGTMTGMKDKLFGPYEMLSRAQFASILYRMEGEPEVGNGEDESLLDTGFTDVTGDEWYGKAVLWAAHAGIVKGYQDNSFGPADNITREQMAIMMYRYTAYKGNDVSVETGYDAFLDASDVSPYAEESMKWAVDAEIITGKEGGTVLDPLGATTRAECAAIIQRFMK